MENTTIQKPYIIVFEGIDGSGKSTQINIVYELLKDKNVKLLREPGSTQIGEKIRDILKSQKLDPKTQTFLIEASRAHMIENHLKGFKGIVLLDRFIYSTIAYQGYGFGVDINFLKIINDFVCDIYIPDIVFLLDIDPKIALERLKREKDVFENLDFLKKVRNGYLELAKEYKFYTIDASKNVEVITDEIKAVLKQHSILS